MHFLRFTVMSLVLASHAAWAISHPTCEVQVPQEASLLRSESAVAALKLKGYAPKLLTQDKAGAFPLSQASFVGFSSWYSLSNNSCQAHIQIVSPYSETAYTKVLEYRLSNDALEWAKKTRSTAKPTSAQLCEQVTLEILEMLPECSRR